MGRRLRQVVRTGDAIARYSGAKFGIILNGCSEEDLQIAAERFLGVARESVIETERGPVWAMLSIGGLVLPKHAGDANTAMARAEEALSKARRLPSDGHVIYRPLPQRTAERQLNAHSATEIVRCLKEDRFRLAFQPIVEAKTRQPFMHEALLRMNDTTGEVIAAAHLIPVAEKLGLVRLIDRAVVQMAVATLNRFPDARLSFNVSGTTATDPRWYPQITEILAANRNVNERLTIEITETVALGDLRETLRFVEQLRELGCSVAIDDFGAGFTSFRHLKELPVDVLKLDGSFCRNLRDNADNQYFVRSLIDMAHKFDFKAVAEWVETEDDANLLRDWNVDFLQGNLFGEASLAEPWRNRVADEPFEVVPVAPPQELATTVPSPPAEPIPDRRVAISLDPGHVAALAAPTPVPEAPPLLALDTVTKDDELGLSALRRAIAALDAAFKRSAPETKLPAAEPSFADLVNPAARQAAG